MQSVTALVLALSVVAAPAQAGWPGGEPSDSVEQDTPKPVPNLRKDIFVVGSVTLLFSAVQPSVRQGIMQRGSIGEIGRNLGSPIRRAVEGAREDVDPFLTNYVAHPVSWAIVGLYLKDRGYSNLGALLFSQVHSVAWEYVIEGSYQKPSGKDLVSNLAGAGAAVYILHPLADRLAFLNPIRPITSRLSSDRVATRVEPEPLRGGVRIGMTVDW